MDCKVSKHTVHKVYNVNVYTLQIVLYLVFAYLPYNQHVIFVNILFSVFWHVIFIMHVIYSCSAHMKGIEVITF